MVTHFSYAVDVKLKLHFFYFFFTKVSKYASQYTRTKNTNTIGGVLRIVYTAKPVASTGE